MEISPANLALCRNRVVYFLLPMKRIERNMVHSMRERADERAEEKREERRREKIFLFSGDGDDGDQFQWKQET